MKRIFIAAALMLAATVAIEAQENVKQKIFTNPDTVTFTHRNGTTSFEVRKNGKQEFSYTISERHSSTSQVNEKWSFDIPFIGHNKLSRHRKHYNRPYDDKFRFHLLSGLEFGMGLATATNQADGMDVKMSNCGWEFTLNNIAGWQYLPLKNTAIQMNFGVNWRNYRMKGDTRFLKDGQNLVVAPYPDGADIEFSRIKIFSLTLEMMLKQRLSRNIALGIGPVVNFNTHGSIKTRYKLDGKGHKETSNNIHQSPVTVDFKAQLAVKPFAFYFKYSPVNTLDTNYGPKFSSMSAGLILKFGGSKYL